MSPRLSPAAAAFASGAAVLAVELLLPRLFARHLGTSIVPWTSVIAGTLLGLAFGGALGGALADRLGPRRAQAALLLAGAAAAAAVPWLDRVAEVAFAGLPLLPRSLATVAVTCLAPAVAWGGVGPACAREAASLSPLAPGRALGRVSAASALGSLAGAFGTGFVLVPSVGTTTAIAAVAALAGIAGAARALEPDGVQRPERAPQPLAPSARRRSRGVPAGTAPPAGRVLADAPPAADEAPIPAGTAGAIAALCGAATLIVEAAAARRASFAVGGGIYGWTSVIGAVLLGAAAGSVYGGRLADRIGPRRTAARMLLISSALVVFTMWTPLMLVATFMLPGMPFPFRMLLGSLLAWGPPAAALAAISPALARSAARAAGEAHAGRAIGRLWALGTAGAVVGVIVTGPLLLPTLGQAGTHAALGIALALATWRLTGRLEWPWVLGTTVILLAATLPWGVARSAGRALGVRMDSDRHFTRETALQHIIVEINRDTPGKRRMRIDAMVHGTIDLDDLTWLGYDYEGLYAAVTDRVVPRGRPPRALFIGGGPYSFPRRMLAVYPDATVDVAEFDPGVTQAARDVMGLVDMPGLRTADADARTFVRDLPASTPPYDLVYGDAFNAFSVPFHLTTIEFARALKARMASDGVYLVNVIDVFNSGLFLGAFVETLSRVFEHVTLISSDRKDTQRNTFVLVATDRPLFLDQLTRVDRGVAEIGKGVPVARYGAIDLAGLRARSKGLVLTDDFAPVENLLAPILWHHLDVQTEK